MQWSKNTDGSVDFSHYRDCCVPKAKSTAEKQRAKLKRKPLSKKQKETLRVKRRQQYASIKAEIEARRSAQRKAKELSSLISGLDWISEFPYRTASNFVLNKAKKYAYRADITKYQHLHSEWQLFFSRLRNRVSNHLQVILKDDPDTKWYLERKNLRTS